MYDTLTDRIRQEYERMEAVTLAIATECRRLKDRASKAKGEEAAYYAAVYEELEPRYRCYHRAVMPWRYAKFMGSHR